MERYEMPLLPKIYCRVIEGTVSILKPVAGLKIEAQRIENLFLICLELQHHFTLISYGICRKITFSFFSRGGTQTAGRAENYPDRHEAAKPARTFCVSTLPPFSFLSFRTPL